MLVAVIFCFRILYVNVYRKLQVEHGLQIYDYISIYLKDWLNVGLTVAFGISFIILLNRKLPYGKAPFKRTAIQIIGLLAVSLLMTPVANRAFPYTLRWESLFSGHALLLFLVVILINVAAVVIADLFFYFKNTRVALAAEKSKKRKAQYQYHQLKQQLNPHFLFNSLNILDCLVQEGDTRRASNFIKKLAGVYRYLLNSGEEKLVTLREEIDFVKMYVELMKERFTAGFNVEIDVPKGDLKKKIVPCSLQLLIENAAKHNIVSNEKPLFIKIYTEGGYISVSNNLQPRINVYESTGLGLSNIRRQYADIAGREITVRNGGGSFIVTLPIL